VHEHLEEQRVEMGTKRSKPDGQELLHKKFIKRILGVCNSTPDMIALGEEWVRVARSPG